MATGCNYLLASQKLGQGDKGKMKGYEIRKTESWLFVSVRDEEG